jgi:tRNA A-37 threonylcarbamoyl transferase component Bud32
MDPTEAVIDRFEEEWRSGGRPSLTAALASAAGQCDSRAMRELALELVKIDLEYRWKAARAAGRPAALRLEGYARRMPLLGASERLPLDLVAEEYRVRKRWGDAPPASEYFARFVHPRREIIAALDRVDSELAREASPLAAPRPPRVSARHAGDPAAPLDISDFVLKRQLGAGGLARVYAGLQISLGKEVAIKVLRRRFWNDSAAVARFLREAQIVAQLPREGIVQVHGLGRLPPGGFFMVLDLIDGRDLRAVRKQTEVSMADALRWTVAAAEIVNRVHQSGFVHGDVKPANLLLEYSGRLVLTDFGFAEPISALPASSRPAAPLVGTPAFLAPEIALAEPPRPPTDIFGLGAVLFWLLTGRTVHEARSLDAVLGELARSEWDAQVKASLGHYVPPPVRQLCAACLARRPEDRPATAHDLVTQLRACLT